MFLGFVNDGRVNGNLNLTRAVGDFAYKKDLLKSKHNKQKANKTHNIKNTEQQQQLQKQKHTTFSAVKTLFKNTFNK